MRRRFYSTKSTSRYNQIWYTTTDDNIISFDVHGFNVSLVSHTYSNGKGIIIFDGDVTSIGERAFIDCSSLTSVTIPDSVTTIGDDAFYNCSSLTSVTIPDSVTTIGNYAFYKCASLTSVTIGNGVTTIGGAAFYECASLTSVTIPDSVTTIGNYAFGWCRSLTSVTIGNSVTTIGVQAFAYCRSLTSVTIPDSVTSIGDRAFNPCESLTSVYCKATIPPILGGGDVFDYDGSGRKIYVPYQSVDAYKTATYWSEYAADIVGYNFENDVIIITFTVNGVEYQAEEGMTWEQWVSSEYSNDAFFISGIRIRFKSDGRAIANVQGVFESKTNSIINDYEYAILFEN